MVSKAKDLLFGKKPGTYTNPTAYETLPDFGQNLLKQIIDQGKGYVDKGIPGVPTLDFKFGQQANGALGQAGDMYGTASGYLDSAMPYLERGGSAITSGEIGSGINDFMSPFEDQVVQDMVGDVSKYGNGLFNDAKSLISDAGVSGSNRGDFLAGDIAGNLMDTIGSESARLRNTGFQSAASNALARLQGDRSNALTAGSQMGNLGATAGGIGNGLVGLGNQYLQGRELMTNIRANQRSQTPQMQDLNLLAKLFQLIPQGGGNVAALKEGTQGLFGSGGFTQALPGIVKSGISLMAGGAGGGGTPWLNPDTNRFV